MKEKGEGREREGQGRGGEGKGASRENLNGTLWPLQRQRCVWVGHAKAEGQLNPGVFHILSAARYTSSSVIDLNLHDSCDDSGGQHGRSGPHPPYGDSSGW